MLLSLLLLLLRTTMFLSSPTYSDVAMWLLVARRAALRRSKRGSAGRMHLSEPLCPLLLSYTFKCLYAWHLLYIRVFKCMACIILQNMNIRPWVCCHYTFKCLYAWLLLASMLATLLYACLLPSTLRVLWNTSDLLRRAAWHLLAQGSTRRGPRPLAILRLRPWASWSHLGAVLDIWATCRCSCTRPSSCGTTSSCSTPALRHASSNCNPKPRLAD